MLNDFFFFFFFFPGDTEPVSIQAGGLAAGKPEDTSSITTGDSALGKSSYTSRMTEFSEVSCAAVGILTIITTCILVFIKSQ